MKSKSFQILQYIILLSIGLGLSWMFFKNLNINDLKAVAVTGNYFWAYLVMIVSLLVYIFRVLRWQMLIKSIGYETGFFYTFAALSLGYFVNFALPRFGEITRCLSVKKRYQIPFMQLLGTVIIERVIDIVSLIIILLLTLILQFNQISDFFRENVFQPLYNGIIAKIMAGDRMIILFVIAALLIFSIIFFYFRKTIRAKSPHIILQFIQGLKEGLASISKLKQKRLFFLYTILIWTCYYLMTYFWIFVFKETSILTLGACLAILCIGTIGRSVPIQGGGMGAYHFLVGQVILIYGVSGIVGKTLAALIHAGQTFFTFAIGLVGLIIFFIGYWKKKE